MSRMRSAILLPLVLIAALAALAEQPRSERIGPPAPSVTDCAECHAAVAASYASGGMARALRPISAVDVSGLGSVPAGSTGFSYRFEKRGAEQRIVEEWTGPDGQPVPGTRNDARLAFAIGAGILDTALVAERGGALWFAPLEILSAQRGIPRHAALAPGHMQVNDLRLRAPITEECLACHTDRLPPRDFPLNALPPHHWQPQGIGCGACHPHGSWHVAWREAELGGQPKSGADPVLDPADLPPLESVSLCARCHLQGDARIYLEPGERGLLPAGGDLLERLAVFVAAGETDEIGFVSQVERMVKSQCFAASLERGERALVCTSCHDAHASLASPAERTRTRAGCVRCHAETGDAIDGRDPPCSLASAERAAQDCVTCHMRLTPPFDVAGVEIHDHFIRRERVEPSRFSSIRTQQTRDGRLERFTWPGERAVPSRGDPGLELMALYAADRPDLALALADKKPAAAIEHLSAYHHLRGSLFDRAGRVDLAVAAYGRALELEPGSPETELNLALALSRVGRGAEGLALLDALLELHPGAEGALRNRALVKLAQNDLAGFRADLEAAQALLPRAENARALASYFRQQGDVQQADRWAVEERRLEPRGR